MSLFSIICIKMQKLMNRSFTFKVEIVFPAQW